MSVNPPGRRPPASSFSPPRTRRVGGIADDQTPRGRFVADVKALSTAIRDEIGSSHAMPQVKGANAGVVQINLTAALRAIEDFSQPPRDSELSSVARYLQQAQAAVEKGQLQFKTASIADALRKAVETAREAKLSRDVQPLRLPEY